MMSEKSSGGLTSRKSHGVFALSAFVAAVLSVWGWVLPMIGNAPTIRRSIDNAERMGINPAAVFYTDVYEKTKIPQRLSEKGAVPSVRH
jgi:hypothetical protein